VVPAGEAFSRSVCEWVARIPCGRVQTYGGIAALAGNHLAARLVARVLRNKSRNLALPWHRIVNREGRISLPDLAGNRQRQLLDKEGVVFGTDGKLDLTRYRWWPHN
jgi:methylated-DNA-protein-cysteine methyltransferase-like protein